MMEKTEVFGLPQSGRQPNDRSGSPRLPSFETAEKKPTVTPLTRASFGCSQ